MGDDSLPYQVNRYEISQCTKQENNNASCFAEVDECKIEKTQL